MHKIYHSSYRLPLWTMQIMPRRKIALCASARDFHQVTLLDDGNHGQACLGLVSCPTCKNYPDEFTLKYRDLKKRQTRHRKLWLKHAFLENGLSKAAFVTSDYSSKKNNTSGVSSPYGSAPSCVEIHTQDLKLDSILAFILSHRQKSLHS